jgi:hypothetical protein
MTQDQPLVARLRTDVLWHRRRGNETIAKDCEEAADEIERLQSALAAQPAPTVEHAIESLVSALAESKGWMRSYADSVVRDAIDRVPTEQKWSEEDAIALMRRAGFAVNCWTMGPYELSCVLNLAKLAAPTEQAQPVAWLVTRLRRKADEGSGRVRYLHLTEQAARDDFDGWTDVEGSAPTLAPLVYATPPTAQPAEQATQSAPEGWQLVPKVPTEAMHAAAVRTIVLCSGNDDFPPRVYRAMLAAAPPQDAGTAAPAQDAQR